MKFYNISKKFYSVSNLSDMLNVTKNTVRNLIKTGVLPASKIGREYRVSETDFQQFFESQRVTV
jgi:excisionase family DNA binding protein